MPLPCPNHLELITERTTVQLREPLNANGSCFSQSSAQAILHSNSVVKLQMIRAKAYLHPQARSLSKLASVAYSSNYKHT